MIRQRLCVLERKTTKIKCLFHHIKKRYHHHNFWLLILTLFTWLRYCSSDFSTAKFFLCPPAPNHTTLFGMKSLCTLREWGFMVHLLRAEYLDKLLGILLHRWFVYFSTFTYFLSHLLRSVWTHRYLFYTWVIIQYCFIFYFIAQMFWLWSLEPL